MQPGGNMEGKEARFGLANSTLWATVTDASCGAINSDGDSFTPLAIPLTNILLSEVIFGGVGAGMYGILIYVILSVFIAGLMVGRTPEYMGKKVEAYDVKMAMLNVLIFPTTILVFTAISRSRPASARRNLTTPGRRAVRNSLRLHFGHGNNGSAFAGFTNTYWYNTTIGFAMLLGRFFMIIPMLALAGNLARKKALPFLKYVPGHDAAIHDAVGERHPDRRRADFLPVLSLGPIVEHLLMCWTDVLNGAAPLVSKRLDAHQPLVDARGARARERLWQNRKLFRFGTRRSYGARCAGFIHQAEPDRDDGTRDVRRRSRRC